MYLWRLIKITLWSFLGIRDRAAFEADCKIAKPLHLAIVGFIVLIVLILLLFVIVKVIIQTHQA